MPDPSSTDDNAWLKTVPLKLCLINIYELGYFYVSSLQKWLAHFYCSKISELSELYIFKTNKSSTLLIRERFQGYWCKFGIAIYAWRVTWNYVYRPFKNWNRTPRPPSGSDNYTMLEILSWKFLNIAF